MRKLPRKLMDQVYQRWKRHGVTISELADEYGVHKHTMAKYLRQYEKRVVEEWA